MAESLLRLITELKGQFLFQDFVALDAAVTTQRRALESQTVRGSVEVQHVALVRWFNCVWF